jgi:signal transduction histidine kinase
VSERNEQGYATRMAGVHLDITVRKEAEERIRELNESLEERVAERSSQLSEALQTLHRSQEALARNAAKATLSTLVASVSHELSTPLGNSLMTASTCSALARTTQAKMESGQLKRSELTDFLAQIGHGTDLIERNLHRSVELMRNFKQVAADQASEQRRKFELDSVVNEVLDTLSPTLKRHTHKVQVDIPEGVWLDSFPGALGQVIINLINNAYLHAFENKTHGTVHIHAQSSGGRVRIAVSDDGSGMTDEHMAQLFQPFFSTKIGRGGTGLGMTIVENLVNKTLGGTLQVESTLGVGTTFALAIPLIGPVETE